MAIETSGVFGPETLSFLKDLGGHLAWVTKEEKSTTYRFNFIYFLYMCTFFVVFLTLSVLCVCDFSKLECLKVSVVVVFLLLFLLFFATTCLRDFIF